MNVKLTQFCSFIHSLKKYVRAYYVPGSVLGTIDPEWMRQNPCSTGPHNLVGRLVNKWMGNIISGGDKYILWRTI